MSEDLTLSQNLAPSETPAPPEDLALVRCPQCDEPAELPVSVLGKLGQCNYCGYLFIIQAQANEPRPVPTCAPKPREWPAWMLPVLLTVGPSLLLLAWFEYGGRSTSQDQPQQILPARAQPAMKFAEIRVAPQSQSPVRAKIGTINRGLQPSDDGNAWLLADRATQMALCESFAQSNNSRPGLPRRDADWFRNQINSFYNSNPQPQTLSQPIEQSIKLGTGG
jgi:hypothetical protein